jgi:hypothetical protein
MTQTYNPDAEPGKEHTNTYHKSDIVYNGVDGKIVYAAGYDPEESGKMLISADNKTFEELSTTGYDIAPDTTFWIKRAAVNPLSYTGEFNDGGFSTTESLMLKTSVQAESGITLNASGEYTTQGGGNETGGYFDGFTSYNNYEFEYFISDSAEANETIWEQKSEAGETVKSSHPLRAAWYYNFLVYPLRINQVIEAYVEDGDVLEENKEFDPTGALTAAQVEAYVTAMTNATDPMYLHIKFNIIGDNPGTDDWGGEDGNVSANTPNSTRSAEIVVQGNP